MNVIGNGINVNGSKSMVNGFEHFSSFEGFKGKVNELDSYICFEMQ